MLSTPLINDFKTDKWWFYIPLMFATLCRAFFIALAQVKSFVHICLCPCSCTQILTWSCFTHWQNHGFVQTIGLLVIESLVLVTSCVFTPFADKSSNGTHITIMIFRVAVSGCLVTFNSSLKLNEIIRYVIIVVSSCSFFVYLPCMFFVQSVAIGIVIAGAQSVVVVGFFILILVDLGAVILHIFREPRIGLAEKTTLRRTDSTTLNEDGAEGKCSGSRE